MDISHRILGALFGVACGDALGCTLEFIDKKTGILRYGYHKDIIGGGIMRLKAGEVTDDTMMTIAVGQGIVNGGDNPINLIGEEFVKWYNTKPKDIGITCEKTIEKFLEIGDWFEAACSTNVILNGKTTGNGSLMRCIPVALYYEDLETVQKISELQSNMTHCAEESAKACSIYNTIVYRYLKGEDKITVLNEVLEFHDEYNKVFNMSKEELKPSGYVVDTLICALWCFINRENVDEIICEAVNLYGDPDTIGAIAGGLAGVYYGYENIPARWKDKIIIKDGIEALGNDIIACKIKKYEK